MTDEEDAVTGTIDGSTQLTAEQSAELAALRAARSETLRAVAPELEELLYTPIGVLDHGFIRVIDYMGNDAAIVQAARVSYGMGTKKRREDAGLIAYLMRNRHTSPFEMCEIKLHVKLPIFVARQWLRHRTASVNEYSARYSILDREFYIPDAAQLATQSSSNRQGRGSVLAPAHAARVLSLLRADTERLYEDYEAMLTGVYATGEPDDSAALARELARINLSLNVYTQFYWKIDLHNLLHFIGLRAASHAQYEIRVYADELLKLVKAWVPLTHAAFENYRLGAFELSAKALSVVRRMLDGQRVDQESSGLSRGEWQELMEALHPTEP